MTTGTFPIDPNNRRAIIVLSQYDIEKCSYERDAAKGLLDDEAYVMPFPVPTQNQKSVALQNILDANLVRPGSILVQSPYDPDIYEEASLAGKKFALTKHMNFSMFCMLLGARKVSVEQIDLKTRTGKFSLDANGNRLGGDVKVTLENEELEKFRAQMSLQNEFEEGGGDIVAAEKFLRRTRLWLDPHMQMLLEMRRVNQNKLMRHKLVLDLSSETKASLSIVGRVNVPGFVKASVDYKRVVSEQCNYTLTILVEF